MKKSEMFIESRVHSDVETQRPAELPSSRTKRTASNARLAKSIDNMPHALHQSCILPKRDEACFRHNEEACFNTRWKRAGLFRTKNNYHPYSLGGGDHQKCNLHLLGRGCLKM